MAPAWKEFADKFAEADSTVKIAELDCTLALNKPITSLYDIMRYPTLIL